MIDVNNPFKVERATDLVYDHGWVSFTMPSGHYTGGEFSVVASFATDEHGFLIGVAADEFGWTHSRLVLDMAKATEIEFTTKAPPTCKPGPFRVGVQFDNLGRLRLTVPDDVAVRLSDWRDSVWTEHGWNSGSSAPAGPGTWEHEALAYLHAIQCRFDGDYPFIEGESYSKGNQAPMVSHCGVQASRPNGGFHFTG